MGVLDDAIRDHLELKRKHGATDEELSRQTAEALGPARRDSPGVDEPLGDEEARLHRPEEGAPEEVAPEEGLPDEAPPERAALEEPTAIAPPGFDESAAETRETPFDHEPEEVEAATRTDAPDAPDEGGSEAVDEGGSEALDEDASDAPVEDAPDEEATEEDVLEETPDFLQETPEHDRLWFEQKPPRDFDFDE